MSGVFIFVNLIDWEGMKYIEEIWYKRKVKFGVRERFCYVIKCMGNVKDSKSQKVRLSIWVGFY